MNKFIIAFLFAILTARFFSETLHLMPKGVDLIDIPVIPLLCLMALGKGTPKGIDRATHGRVLRFCGIYAVLCLVSAMINFQRVFVGPVVLYIFGILEGPLLYVCLNKLIRNKQEFSTRLSKFIGYMVLIQAAVVIFVNLPVFLVSHNPDVIAGTFGKNAYQFSAFL